VHEKKPNTCKNISPIFKYLNFIFWTTTNFKSNSIFASSIKTHDYNNLTFEVHANKSQEIMYPKIMLLSPIKSSTCYSFYWMTLVFCCLQLLCVYCTMLSFITSCFYWILTTIVNMYLKLCDYWWSLHWWWLFAMLKCGF
jgi:hypothetical protein